MATSWADFLSRLRIMGNDNGPTKKISDDTWLSFANTGLLILARDRGVNSSLVLSGDGPDYVLPSDFVRDRYVTSGDGTTEKFLKRASPKAGDSYSKSRGPATSYIVRLIDDSTLSLMAPASAGYTYTLYYTSTYTPIQEGGYLPFNSDWRELALAYITLAVSLAGMEYKRAELEQYASAPELKVGNPASELANEFYDRYLKMIAMRV